MEMHTGLWQHQEIKLSLTQELAQAIALLQYNTQELSSFLEAKALENPLMEVDTTARYRGKKRVSTSERKENDINGLPMEAHPTLEEHLFSQVPPGELNKFTRLVFKLLILNMDENGYFRGDIDQIATSAKTTTDMVEGCLDEIQKLEPAGIGARSLQECLLLQLNRLGDDAENAKTIVTDYFTEFADKKWKQISKELKLPLHDIQQVQDLLQTLNPRPGAPFFTEKASYIVPDVVVEYSDGKWAVKLVEGTVPSIGFNDSLYQSLSAVGDRQAIKFLNEKFNDYQWLARSIRQRNETLLKVTAKIVEKQTVFFEKGKGQLRPLTMKEVADEIGVHESTVSRTVREKYIGTPFGTFELKLFFLSGIQTVADSNASSSQVKALIKEYINNEDKRRPISDQDIADRLMDSEGLVISRRTVAKYREQLGIPSSSKRKRF
ncbi:RNA polymerase sigma-54 factor [Bacillus sp. FJAT-27225]|uniref:RNA polymerase factor sigma-54 n=1 Tax=Bacillus sp. FJAT-27225 TaxID=1743144 RepID=UPI00080C267F|nr:RNA polymerase factor sigma-54 [Bacillus sp. FJAT-27225]OCA88166.1 RNA polymerase sigma-54 factor [Bacillus sp. FJAT-27225]